MESVVQFANLINCLVQHTNGQMVTSPIYSLAAHAQVSLTCPVVQPVSWACPVVQPVSWTCPLCNRSVGLVRCATGLVLASGQPNT